MEEGKFFSKNYRYVAEFNTSQDTLRQLATMEWNIDSFFDLIYSDGIDKNDIQMIKKVFHYIIYIYADRIRSFSWEILKPEFEKQEQDLEKMYDDWIKNHSDSVPSGMLKKLRLYKLWLYEIKQKRLKLGVPTKVESTAKERLDKATGA